MKGEVSGQGRAIIRWLGKHSSERTSDHKPKWQEAMSHVQVSGRNITGTRTRHNFNTWPNLPSCNLQPDLPHLGKKMGCPPSLPLLQLTLSHLTCSLITPYESHKNLIWSPFAWETPFMLRTFRHTLLPDPLSDRDSDPSLPVLHTSLPRLGKCMFNKCPLLGVPLALFLRRTK